MKHTYLFVRLLSLTLITLAAYYFWPQDKASIANKLSQGHYCAVQASPDVRTFSQPDGTTFQGYVRGNGVAHYIETEDGYTLLQDNDGFYKYAISIGNGDLAVTNMRSNPSNQRSAQETTLLNSIDKHLRYTGEAFRTLLSERPQPTSGEPQLVFPSTGTRKALLLLVDYPDQLATYSLQDFDNLANQTGYNVNGQTGSFRDYYIDISYGALVINTDLQGWFTAPNNRATYGRDAGYAAATDLIRFAVDEAEAAGTDFSQYDGDGDGRVDVVMVIHSGRGTEESGDYDDIWSHRWVMSGGGNAVTYDGVLVNDYIIQAEKYGSTNITNIGVLCHEFGHALGLPDLYDTDGSSSGIGRWGLMSGGSWNNAGRTPAQMSAWCKEELGWMNPTVLTNDNTVITDMDYSDNIPASYRVNTPVSNEYFLIENRQKQGWDAYLPSEGMAIWHIDASKDNNADDANRLVNLEAADGSDNGSLFPGYTNNTAFSDITNPNSQTYNNSSSGFCISNITENGNLVSFEFNTTCAPATCDDGLQNGDELGVDCGGSNCGACPCDDGVQNGDEEGIDCGGSFCEPCVCENTAISVPSVTSGVAAGNGNNCDLRASEDATYQFTTSVGGIWTISTCNMATYDTYLYLGTTCCSQDVALNDDASGCSGYSSRMEVELAENTTYYITVEGYSTNVGSFDLEIIAPADCSTNDEVFETRCAGDGYELIVGNDIYNENNPTGTTVLTNTAGCDSTIFVMLVFNETNITDVVESHCSDDNYSITVGNDIYDESNTNGSTILQNQYGCDSIVNVNLMFNESHLTDIVETHCQGSGFSLIVGNDIYDESNTNGSTVLQNQYGCDSTINVTLTFNDSDLTDIVETHCQGSGFSLTVGNDIYDESNTNGSTVLQNQYGCDSIINVNQ